MAEFVNWRPVHGPHASSKVEECGLDVSLVTREEGGFETIKSPLQLGLWESRMVLCFEFVESRVPSLLAPLPLIL